MNTQPPIQEPPKPSPPTSPSPFRVRSSQFREYISKRRWWLWTGVMLILICMIISLIFLAHKFFVEFGGQGFLKAREEAPQPTIFLPLRQRQLERRKAGKNVPYYACGDQLDSCGAYNHLNVCCPVKMYCHGPTLYTLSGIFCCNATSPSNCHISKENSPQCPRNTFQCTAATGGGCCDNGTICTPNGCVKIVAPSIISDETTSKSKPTASPYTDTTLIGNGNAEFTTGSVITSTVTERPAATITEVKQGEVAQDALPNGGTHQYSPFTDLYLPYVCTTLVVLMALVMGFL